MSFNCYVVIVPFWKTNAYIACCLVSPGQGTQLSIYIQLISLPIKVMKQSAAAFISLAPTDIRLVDERTTGFQHQTTKKLCCLTLAVLHLSGDNYTLNC